MWEGIAIVALALAAGFAALAWHERQAERRRGEARVRALSEAIGGAPLPQAVVPGGMFETPRGRGAGGALLKLAAGFGAAVLVVVVIAMSGGRPDAPAAGAPETGSLELLSMRHDRDGDTLTVTGLVRNADGTPASGVTAVVFAFGRDGGFVASGSAPLELSPLSTGDESPFRVSISDLEDVGRYRVSFRTSDGVVRHVDRRGRTPATTS